MSAKPFQRPEIFDNPIGWGPSTTPAQFDDVPYAPFGKGDKLGKVADWTAAPFGGHQSRFQQRGGYQGGRSSTPTEGGFGYVHEEDEGDFKLVDTSAKSKQKAFRQVQRGRWGTGAGFRRDRRRGDGRPAASAGARRQQAPRGKRWKTNNRRFGGYGRYGSDQKRALEPSVEVKSDWRLVDQYDFSSLTKLNSEEPPSDDLVTCGGVQVLDKSYTAVSTKTEKPLERIERTFFKVTTSDDPIIRELVMQEGAGNVFATDAILACLMACPRSVYSWDIVIQRVGSKLFFDKRDNSHFDFLTVNETAHDMLYDDKDGINSPANLSEEATFINQNFSQQILQNEKEALQRPNPFQEGEEDDDIPVASTGYRYRRFHLNDEVDLVVRCEVDAVLPKLNPEAPRQYVTIKALNEYEPKPGVEWRQKLDTQRGAVLATELKNNAFKLAQWCAQSILAGSDQFVLGYVSRVNPKDSYNHTILGLQSYKPTEFANQINLNIRNMWGILKGVIDTCMQLPEGKFLLLKDPNKAMISLYAVPQDAFDDLDDDTEASDELIEDEAELEEDETDDENYA